jgi:hypothetical protein
MVLAIANRQNLADQPHMQDDRDEESETRQVAPDAEHGLLGGILREHPISEDGGRDALESAI